MSVIVRHKGRKRDMGRWFHRVDFSISTRFPKNFQAQNSKSGYLPIFSRHPPDIRLIRECYLDENRSSFHFLYTTFMADINVGHQHSIFSLWVFASVHICTLKYYHNFLPSKVEILILSIKLRITLFKIVSEFGYLACKERLAQSPKL